MDFQEQLSAAISQGLAQVEAEHQDDRDFGIQWSNVRRDVNAVLVEAEGPIQQNRLGQARADHENGCTILFVKRGGEKGEREFALRFCADKATRKIACKTGLSGTIDESYTPAELTRDVVEGKILEFVQAILALLKSERPR